MAMGSDTIKELTDRALGRLKFLRAQCGGDEAREYSLAITDLENAQMRATRGLAMRQGKFTPADLEKGTPA